MSGHSKFANIKHKKEKNDAAKGKIFTKIGKELMVAIKEGGGADPANNSRLRDVIAKAKANNMPNDTIERNIKKASGDANAANYESITYEGYGPNGTAIIVETLTDNRNRTATNVKNAFTKGKGSVGTPGCVSFSFDEKGQIIKAETYEGDQLVHIGEGQAGELFEQCMAHMGGKAHRCFCRKELSGKAAGKAQQCHEKHEGKILQDHLVITGGNTVVDNSCHQQRNCQIETRFQHFKGRSQNALELVFFHIGA